MDFIDQAKQFSKKIASLKDTVQNEQSTKISLIMPFFSMLGYDVFNPTEFSPEFTADFGSKNHYKVDYAIILEGKPTILIECKDVSAKLDRHDAQLFGYFVASVAKFAILTNGLEYRFYTDLDKPNIMDSDPFLTVNLLDLRDAQIAELKKFCKEEFNIASIFSTASDLKYAQQFKQTFRAQLENPSDELVRLFLKDSYSGQKISHNVIDKFRPVLRKALNEYVNEWMHDKITHALNGDNADNGPNTISPDAEAPAPVSQPAAAPKQQRIVTTEEELEAYFIIKNMLSDVVDLRDVTYKDTESYINILYQGNSWKWICRLRLTDTKKILIIPDENKHGIQHVLQDIYDLKQYESALKEVLQRYLSASK